MKRVSACSYMYCMIGWCDIYLDFIAISHTYVTVIHHEVCECLYLHVLYGMVLHVIVFVLTSHAYVTLICTWEMYRLMSLSLKLMSICCLSIAKAYTRTTFISDDIIRYTPIIYLTCATICSESLHCNPL